MTIRKTTAITLEEITAIQFECRRCNTRMSVLLSGGGRFLSKCHFCGDSWLVNNRTDLHERYFKWVEQLITAIKQVSDNSNNVNFLLRAYP